jgi:hypothetical protein
MSARGRRFGRLVTCIAAGLALAVTTARGEAPLVPSKHTRGAVLHDRLHPGGATLVRFHQDRLHFALVLDQRPEKVEEKRVTLADGRTIDFRWSARSLWIAGQKFELPFGDIFLVDTRDSIRARALEFRAVRGDWLLARLADAPEAAAWLETYGTSGAPPVRQEAEATTQPRHTTEVAEWTWRGLHALTYLVSGEPLFVLVADRPVFPSGVSTSFGGFDKADIRIGAAAGDRLIASRREAVFELRAGADHPRSRAFQLSNGRAFMVRGEAVRQIDVPFDLGPSVADALIERIEALPEVAGHLGSGTGE